MNLLGTVLQKSYWDLDTITLSTSLAQTKSVYNIKHVNELYSTATRQKLITNPLRT